MADTKAFRLTKGVTSKMVCHALEDFLRDSEGMITQSGRFSKESFVEIKEETEVSSRRVAEGYFVQGKKKVGIWSGLSGVEQAVTVYIIQVKEVVNITVGFGKWLDDNTDLSLGTFFDVSTSIIMKTELFLRRKTPIKILNFTEKFIISGGQGVKTYL